MERTPVALIEAMYAARQAKDVTAMMAYCHDDIVFTFNADPDKIGSGNTLVGIPASLAHLTRVTATWEQLDYKVGPLIDDGNHVRTQIEFTLRHRATGQVLSGKKRQEWTVLDGRVASLVEYLDSDFIAAFMRMAEASVA